MAAGASRTTKPGGGRGLPGRLARQAVFRRQFAKLDAENEARVMLPSGFHWRKFVRLLVTGGIVAILVWFVSARVSKYFDWQGSLARDPMVYNLTAAGVEWDVFYGHSEKCGEKECLLLPDAPPSAFSKRMVLPAREFPLKDYKKGDIIYLRTEVDLPHVLQTFDGPISFQSIYVWAKTYTFFVNGVALDEGGAELLNIPLPRSLIPRDGHIQLALRIDPGDLPYQGLAHRGDLFLGPKATLAKTQFDAQEFKTTYYLWFILPKLTFCLIFAFLFLAVSRHRELFSFIVFSFVGSLDLFFHSGYVDEMLPHGPNWQLIGLTLRALAAVMFMRFIHDFYRRKSRNLQRFQAVCNVGILIFATLAMYVLPKKGGYDAAVVLVAVLQIISLVFALWTSAVVYLYLASNGRSQFRERSALFVTVFMGVACLLMIPYSTRAILEVFGLAGDFSGINLAATFDLAFFLVLSAITATEFGLTVSAKEVSEAKIDALELRMELAQTVQQLLLPKRFEGETLNAAFRFHYEPAEKMSGDWLSIWSDEGTGAQHLFFGDVVGKGPQAALAVSAIASMMSDARARSLDVPGALAAINLHLRLLFEGHINTTVAAISLHEDGHADLYNCGTIGWIAIAGTKADYFPMRSAPLGVNPDPKIGHLRLKLVPPTTLFTFSDGCLEGSRALKVLLESLRKNPGFAHVSAVGLIQRIIAIGKEGVKADDKTALVVSTEKDSIMRVPPSDPEQTATRTSSVAAS